MSPHYLLLVALLVANVSLRVFTNEWNILPRIFNVADIGIVLLLCLLALVGGYRNPRSRQFSGMRRGFVVFSIIGLVGTMSNLQFIYPPSALSQWTMWVEPIALFLAIVGLRFTSTQIHRYWKILAALIVIEVLIGTVQAPFAIKRGASEDIIGTFRGNAEQYAAFILIGMFYLLGKWEVSRTRRLKYLMAAAGILVLIILIDNKASWVAMGVALFYLFFRVLAQQSAYAGWMRYAIVFVLVASLGVGVIVFTSGSLKKYEMLYTAIRTGNFFNIGKIKSFYDVGEAFVTNPQMTFVGSGLGTFYSRAAFQYFPRHEDLYSSPPPQNVQFNDSASMGGVIESARGVEPYFRQFFKVRKIFPIGSGTADNPCSSYASLLGEMGVIGFVIYLSFYVVILKRLKYYSQMFVHDRQVYPWCVATIGFLVYMLAIGSYNFWLECGRITTILWSMIGLLLRQAELLQDAQAEQSEDVVEEIEKTESISQR